MTTLIVVSSVIGYIAVTVFFGRWMYFAVVEEIYSENMQGRIDQRKNISDEQLLSIKEAALVAAKREAGISVSVFCSIIWPIVGLVILLAFTGDAISSWLRRSKFLTPKIENELIREREKQEAIKLGKKFELDVNSLRGMNE